MRRWFRPNILLISTSILGLGVYLMILFQLPALQTELRYGLRYRLEEIAATQVSFVHQQLAQRIDQQWKKISEGEKPLAAIVRDAGQLRRVGPARGWQIQSLNQGQGVASSVADRLNQQLALLLRSDNESLAVQFWGDRLDSCLYIRVQENPLQKALLYVCKPVFAEQKLQSFWYLQLDRRFVERSFLPKFFRQTLSPLLEEETRKWAQQTNFQWRDERGNMVFNYPALARGKMEVILPQSDNKPLLKMYRIEAGWQGRNSEEIAASVYQRNLWVLHAMLLLFAMLMLFAYRTQQKSARLEQLKTDFISQMSHELKTPIATIKLASETLQKGRFRTMEDASKRGDLIYQQSQILADRINRLFEFSHSAEGQPIPKRTHVSIKEVWQRLQQRANIMAQSWQRELQIQGEAFGEASLSEEATWSIIEILLENAFQYGGPKQSVKLDSQIHTRHWQLSVIDQGPGIAKEEQELVFEKFVRLDSPDTQSKSGYGMGLAIARQLATRMNGQLILQSKAGQGSRFTLQIPISA